MDDLVEGCVSCRYWCGIEEYWPHGKQGWGQCRRYAPQAVMAMMIDSAGDVYAVWPKTRSSDRCGDWARSGDSIDTAEK
jgi:hypothetical protein